MEKELDDNVVAEAPAPELAYPEGDARNDVAAAIASLKKPAEEEAPAVEADAHPEPVEDKGDHPSDPKRYADGTFKPVKADKPISDEPAPDKAAASDTKLPPVDNTAKASTEQPSNAVGAPPVSWAAEAKAAWAGLSPAIQNAVLKRESEVSAGFKQKSEEVRRYEGMIAPVAQEAARLGMQPDQALSALMAAHHALQRNAPAAIARLASQYGVDLATLASNPPAAQTQQFDPMVSQLSQTVQSLESRLSGYLQNQTMSIVDSFAKDPKHPHYEAVESEIAELLPVIQQANPGLSPYETLEKAYDRAIWSNADVRAKLIAEQTAQVQRTQVQALQSKAKQATKAAVSIKGASNGSAPPPKANGTAGGSVYDDVRAAIHQLRQ